MSNIEIDEYLDAKILNLYSQYFHVDTNLLKNDDYFIPSIDNNLDYCISFEDGRQIYNYRVNEPYNITPFASVEKAKQQTFSYKVIVHSSDTGAPAIGSFRSTVYGYIKIPTNTAYIQSVSTNPKTSGTISYANYYVSGGKRAVLSFRNYLSNDSGTKIFYASGVSFGKL